MRKIHLLDIVTAPALALLFIASSVTSSSALPDDKEMAAHAHGRKPASELVEMVREATERFKDPAVAMGEGYGPLFGCVSGDAAGAMGQHYVNSALVGDDVLDVTKPEIVIYETTPNGKLRLIGADYLVFADVWHQTHTEVPQIMGQLLHLFPSPNRFGLPAFYTLHVWAWKENPTGMFVNWHANVSCEGAK